MQEIPLTKRTRTIIEEGEALERKAKSQNKQLKADLVQMLYNEGGRPFLSAVEQYGANEQNEPIKLYRWYREHLLILGDLRIAVVVNSGAAQIGKANPIDSKVLTPKGWKLMGEIKVGDWVICGEGIKTKVTGVFPQGKKQIFDVIFDDGSKSQCCEEHLWLTQTKNDRNGGRKRSSGKGRYQRTWEPTQYGERPGTVKTLKEIRETLYLTRPDGSLYLSRGKPSANHSVDFVKPVRFEDDSKILLSPYLMGALLADGSFRVANQVSITCGTLEFKSLVEKELPSKVSLKQLHRPIDYKLVFDGDKRHPVKHAVKEYGLTLKYSYEKHIPEVYRYRCIKDRLALLQGLMDGDGSLNSGQPDGHLGCQFNSSSETLIHQVRELVLSLGGNARAIKSRIPTYTHNGEQKQGRRAYRFTFRLPDGLCPFRMSDKVARYGPTCKPRRFIYDVVPAGEKECQCISVAHPSHLYVVDDYIVTHNTLSVTLLMCYLLSEGSFNIIWAYDQQASRDIQVVSNFRPVILNWLTNKGISIKGSDDKQNNTLFQVEGATAQFTYVSTTSQEKSGKAAAGGVTVGVSRDIAVLEERSQYPPGAADPIERRLDNSRLPTKPVRPTGTKGGGLGIEAEIKRCEYQFYPHYKCECCGEILPLHPKGCLLKLTEVPSPSGEVRKAYLSSAGRPLDWFHEDEENPIDTAYYACSSCGYPLSDAVRETAFYQDTITGITAADFIVSLPKGIPNRRISASLDISPLLRIQSTNRASEIIAKGLSTDNTADWQQQMLGCESEAGAGSISLAAIQWAMKGPVPEFEPTFRLAGCDQGRGQHWLWICEYYVPQDLIDRISDKNNKERRLSLSEVSEKTLRHVIFAKDVGQGEIPGILNQYGVRYGLVDNEPERAWASSLRQYNIDMADQKSSQTATMRDSYVEHGGAKYPCKFISNNFFMKAVQDMFFSTADDSYPLIRLPESWKRWVALIDDERSPIRHLMAPRFDATKEKWIRPDDRIDDLYFAAVFCEAAFYVALRQALLTPYHRVRARNTSTRRVRNVLKQLD